MAQQCRFPQGWPAFPPLPTWMESRLCLSSSSRRRCVDVILHFFISDCCPEPVLAKSKRNKRNRRRALSQGRLSRTVSVFPMPAPVLLLQVPTVFGHHNVIPGAVLRHLDEAGAPPTRVASFHEYYNQGPWEVRTEETLHC